MKYLRKFNESEDYSLEKEETNELKDFCSTHLAYLLDDGFELYIENTSYYISDDVYTYINLSKSGNTFNLSKDIKNILIPFLIILSEQYSVDDEYILRYSDSEYKREDDILTLDELDSNIPLYHIDSIIIKIIDIR